MNLNLHQPPAAILEHFAPHTARRAWRRAPDGFSGATVWRGDDAVALKAWPAATRAERLRQIHAWLAHAAHLPFVPAALAGAGGRTTVVVEGHVWDATRWMPGVPRAAPSSAEVRAACEAVARLHLCWPAVDRRPCRGVVARLQMLTDHRALYVNDPPPVAPELDALLRRARRAVANVADDALAALRPWAAWPLAARPCVRDLRGEHVLFEAGRVSGVIDFGAMAVDHVAVDLARLLGDYAAADEARFRTGLEAYREAGGPLDAPDGFVGVLTHTGAVCSLVGWLIRLVARREAVSRPPATAERLAQLITRVESTTHF